MLKVLLLSMVPIIELRGSIPLGILVLGLDWPIVLTLGILGSLVPALGIVFLLKKILVYLEESLPGNRLVYLISWFIRKKSRPVERWGSIGLIALVAVPLPFTGAWTGALVASGLGLDYWKAVSCILVGLVVAGSIVTGLSLL